MECPMLCGSQAADEFHCPDCGWEDSLVEKVSEWFSSYRQDVTPTENEEVQA